MKIRFNISGFCEQEIKLYPNRPFTEEQILAALNGYGPAVSTTVQEGGELLYFDADGHEIVLGIIESSSVDGEYAEFEKVD